MGVLPLEFAAGESAASLGLTGHEEYRIRGHRGDRDRRPAAARRRWCEADGRTFTMRARIDTPFERQVFRAGGILACTLRAMLSGSSADASAASTTVWCCTDASSRWGRPQIGGGADARPGSHRGSLWCYEDAPALIRSLPTGR